LRIFPITQGRDWAKQAKSDDDFSFLSLSERNFHAELRAMRTKKGQHDFMSHCPLVCAS